MLSDIAERCPELQVECSRDYKRLLSAIDQHGLHFFVEVLPSFGKHFDLCLSNERLTKSGLTHLRPFKNGVVVPRLFKGLLLRVFDQFGALRSSPDVTAIRDIRQLCTAVKKLRIACPDTSTWKQVDEFYRTDREVAVGSLNWDYGDFDADGAGVLQFGDHLPSVSTASDLFGDQNVDPPPFVLAADFLDTVQRTADIVCSEIGRFNPSEWKAKHGPGAVSDLRGGSYKYDFPHWPDKLDAVFPYADFAFSNYQHWADSIASDGGSCELSHEPPARLHAVPKSYSGPRLIAAEPVAHQWCQQVVRDFLMSRVEDTCLDACISFRDQTPNQVLAAAASHHGSHSTIDLKSASDRISCWVIERLFRRSPSLLSALYATRTRWITQSLDKKSPEACRLRKFSTMGSAVTFPVQTILFSVLAVSSVLYTRSLRPTSANLRKICREVRVFGDDIIVPLDSHDNLTGLLTAFGLKVNPAKTFSTGKFRESCGYDAYDGNDVTKVSILSVPVVSKPESILSAVDTQNNLFLRGWYRAAAYIKRTVERFRNYKFRTFTSHSGAIGWMSLFEEGLAGLRTRFNPILQRQEVRVSRPCGAPTRTPADSNAMILQYFTEVKRIPDAREERLGYSALRHPLKLRWVWEPIHLWIGGGLTTTQAIGLKK
jgi:hypothetical protein